MTDNYQFNKSNLSENVDSYSPFTDKQWNYIPDINSNVYQNSGLTLVQWDLSSIYNSATFSDVSEFYITLPIVMSAMFGTANAVVAPAAGHFASLVKWTCKSHVFYMYLLMYISCKSHVFWSS